MGSADEGTGRRRSSPFGRKPSSPMRNGSSPTRAGPSSSDAWSSPTADTKFEIDPDVPLEPMAAIGTASATDSDVSGPSGEAKGLIIGDELLNEKELQEEMQRKKERIIMQSLRRKQQQEENRLRREEETRRREEEEKEREEEKLRRKEEEKARRDAILEQHRLKKELEKEDGYRMPEPVSARPVPKLRSSSAANRTTGRQRPKTIHVDQNDPMAMVGTLGSSRGTRGSSSNISGKLIDDDHPFNKFCPSFFVYYLLFFGDVLNHQAE